MLRRVLGGVRWYSPVRSQIPRPPLRRIRRRPAQIVDVKADPRSGFVNESQSGASANMSPSLAGLLSEPVLVVERQLELFNVFLSYEQARRFTLYRADGSVAGYMEEVDMSFARAIARQFTKLHRPFTVEVYDAQGQHAMTIRRPFSFINSHIRCLLPGATDSAQSENESANLIGESIQEWHLWRRRYNLYLHNSAESSMDQFGRVDAPFLSFSFPVANDQGKLLGAVDRNWVGLAREMFTDTGVYVLRQTPEALVGQENVYGAVPAGQPLTLEERAVMLATAVSIDFDYFSRHSSGPGVMVDEP